MATTRKIEMYRQAATAHAVPLSALVTEYRRVFGPIIRLGNLEYRVEAIEQTVPGLSPGLKQ